MTDLYDAAEAGDLERVRMLVEQGEDKNQVGGEYGHTALCVSSRNGYLNVVRYLVEQGADMEKVNQYNETPLHYASCYDHLDVVRYLLEQGANRDKAGYEGWTPLHEAVAEGHLEIAKLLMVYGVDLNARDRHGLLPIDLAHNEEMRRAIRDEPSRRMDHGHKRSTDQNRHPDAATHQEEEEGEEHINKKQCFDEGTEAVEGKVAEEDEPSEPSDEEDGN